MSINWLLTSISEAAESSPSVLIKVNAKTARDLVATVHAADEMRLRGDELINDYSCEGAAYKEARLRYAIQVFDGVRGRNDNKKGPDQINPVEARIEALEAENAKLHAAAKSAKRVLNNIYEFDTVTDSILLDWLERDLKEAGAWDG